MDAAVQRALLSPDRATGITLVTMVAHGYRPSVHRDADGWPRSGREQMALYESNWRCYAALHRYQLYVERTDSGSFPRTDVGLRGEALAYWKAQPGAPPEAKLRLPPPYHPYWMKVVLLRRYLPQPAVKWVVWFDADVLFISLPTDLAALLERAASPSADLVVFGKAIGSTPADELRGALCACIFAVRNSPGGAWFVERWYALRHRTVQWGDQGALNQAVIEMNLRYAAALAAGPGAPPWHAQAWDNVTSPCLAAHWSIGEHDTRTPAACLARVAHQLRAERGMPTLDERSAWPVAWSTELAGNYNAFRLPGAGSAWMYNRTLQRQRWPAVRAQLADSLLRHNAPRGAGGAAPLPRLLAHTKTGPRFPLATLYHRSALPALAKTCPAAIGCANASEFVRGAYAVDGAASGAAISSLLFGTPGRGAAECRGRRGDAALRSVSARLAHAWRALRAHYLRSHGSRVTQI